MKHERRGKLAGGSEHRHMTWGHRLLNKAVGWATRGLPGLAGAEHLARHYARRYADPEQAIDRLVRRQLLFIASTSALTGLGGFVSLPITLPSNLTGVIVLQTRMVLAIAHLRGHDIADERVRTAALACLGGQKALDLLHRAGVHLDNPLAVNIASSLSSTVLQSINQSLATQVVKRIGMKAPERFARFAPLAGGAISGGLDFAASRGIAKAARKLFVPKDRERAQDPGKSA